MDEIKSLLEPKEKVVWNSQPGYAPYITSAVFGSLMAAVFVSIFIGAFLKSLLLAVIIGIIIFASGIIISQMAYKRTHYAITNKRAIIQSGIIGRDFKSIDYDRMQNVSVNVGLLGVIFKVGSVRIFTGELETVGSGKNSRIQAKYDGFNYVKSPYEVLKKLQTHLSKRKEKLA